MIIHKLIAHHLKHRDDAGFYSLQASDAVEWMEKKGVQLTPGTRALDLGCGHGVFGAELMKRGCNVAFADYDNSLLPELAGASYQRVDIDKDDITKLGQYDLVVCSNVLEHLADPARFIRAVPRLITPGGNLYLSWTNWLSPWGGHEFSPFHYLGPRRGHLVYERITGKKRYHTPYQNLFPTYIGSVLKTIRMQPELKVMSVAPRYYSELGFLLRVPIVREFLAWNCALLIRRNS